jgi:hypothetical protein
LAASLRSQAKEKARIDRLIKKQAQKEAALKQERDKSIEAVRNAEAEKAKSNLANFSKSMTDKEKKLIKDLNQKDIQIKKFQVNAENDIKKMEELKKSEHDNLHKKKLQIEA